MLKDCSIKFLNDEFDFFWNKIEKKENFALLRYGDGERHLMTGKNIKAQEGWSSTNEMTKLGNAINQAYQLVDDRVWHGISCPCCDLESFYWYRLCAKSTNLTFANIWVNKNFTKFKYRFNELRRDVILIANYRARGHKIANLNILKHYEINDDCIDFYQKSFASLVKEIKNDFGTKNNLLYVVSAGPLSEPLIMELFKNNPNNTYVNFGSVIDFYYRDNITRDYMIPTSKYGSRNCYMNMSHPNISVVLNLYKRPENLEQQIDAINNQTLKAKEIILFQDGTEDDEKIVIPENAKKSLKIIKSSPVNVGVYGRFKFAQEYASSTFVCIFDDDTIPGKDWLANCFNEFIQQEGLYGTIGIISLGKHCKYPYGRNKNWIRIGWEGNLSSSIEVDFVGHSWFLKKSWIQYLFEAPQAIQNMKYVGEDMCLSFELQKHGIKTFVPPHPKGKENFYGSIPVLANKLGNKKNAAISHRPGALTEMNRAFEYLRKLGWNFVYQRHNSLVRDVYYSLKNDKENLTHYPTLKEHLQRINRFFRKICNIQNNT